MGDGPDFILGILPSLDQTADDVVSAHVWARINTDVHHQLTVSILQSAQTLALQL